MVILAGCAPSGAGVGSQPSIQAHLVVHVDPMARLAGDGCGQADLQGCGPLAFEPFLRRTRNLTWLAQTWVASGRTVDLQLGPEAALAWAGHPETLAVLGEDAQDVADEGMCAVRHLMESGQASLGLHMHSVMPDTEQTWGALAVPAADDPCASSDVRPVEEVSASQVEALVHYGATAVHPIASMLGASIDSFTAHVPRSMATKIAVLEDPDGIDQEVQRSFPDTFRPSHLSSALSECFQHAVDHPPFEVYAADRVAPLVAGDGPMVIPGNRVVGSMAPHLGQASDGSLGAARRRLLQLMLNWRVSGLRGDAPRPWVYAFHAHLFDLGQGTPDPFDDAGRLRAASQGHPFRADVEALALTVDQLAARGSWRGARGEQGVMAWSLPEALDVAGSQFGQSEETEQPYLPLVTERLAHSHLVCSAAHDGFDIFELERCPGGWEWGGDQYGQHCISGRLPEAVTVVVAAHDRCVAGPSRGLSVGEVDGVRMSAPARCPGGLRVPAAGLIIERIDGQPWRAELCGSGLPGVLSP